MCLLIFAYRRHPRYPLLLAANRDEFHARPTRKSQFWNEHPDLLAGKDLQAGGTWMGTTRSGRFAAVTNFRDPAQTTPAPRSRGDLPLEFLTGQDSPASYLQQVAARGKDYAGFNLLLGDGTSLWYYSNSLSEPPTQLQPGIYGLSNAHLDTPWPKVTRGKAVLRTALGGRIDHARLAEVVGSSELADADALAKADLSGEMDQLLSAQFIINQQYGTRAMTTLWQNDDGMTSWSETSFDGTGKESGRVLEQFAPGS